MPQHPYSVYLSHTASNSKTWQRPTLKKRHRPSWSRESRKSKTQYRSRSSRSSERMSSWAIAELHAPLTRHKALKQKKTARKPTMATINWLTTWSLSWSSMGWGKFSSNLKCHQWTKSNLSQCAAQRRTQGQAIAGSWSCSDGQRLAAHTPRIANWITEIRRRFTIQQFKSGIIKAWQICPWKSSSLTMTSYRTIMYSSSKSHTCLRSCHWRLEARLTTLTDIRN